MTALAALAAANKDWVWVAVWALHAAVLLANRVMVLKQELEFNKNRVMVLEQELEEMKSLKRRRGRSKSR